MTDVARLVALIDEQLADTRFTVSERLRTAAFYGFGDGDTPFSPADWVTSCALRGIKPGTARNRLSEVRRLWGLA